MRGEGAVTGPDLSNLTYRDAASVWRDIIEPSATLHPDYIAYHIQLENGEERTGFVRAHDSESIRLTAADGKEEPIHRIDIKGLRVSEVSLMPAGLAEGASEAQRQDLLTFLLHAPPVRTAVELEAVFGKPTPAPVPVPEAARPVKLVLVASAQDHGPGEHDYPAWQRKWLELLDQLPQVTAEAATNWPAAEQFRAADGIVFYYWNHDWNAERLAQLDEFLARGGGVVVLHSATIADRDPEQLAGRIGLAAQPGRTKYLHCPFDLKLVAPTNHPITRGLPSLIRFLDEPYWPMIGDTNQVEVLATARQDASDWPLLWTFQKGPGRVFGSILGHYTWTFDDPMFRALWLRGTAWAIREAPERFAELIAK